MKRLSVRRGFAFAKIYPPPFCLLESVGGECFQSFASISNRGFVIRILGRGRKWGEGFEGRGMRVRGEEKNSAPKGCEHPALPFISQASGCRIPFSTKVSRPSTVRKLGVGSLKLKVGADGRGAFLGPDSSHRHISTR
jgi:hypothetical protein